METNKRTRALGTGSCSILISPNNKQVMRINNQYDYAFQIYADLCIQNPENPYFQNIENHWLLDDGTHVTLTERLLNIPSHKEENSKNSLHRTFGAYCLHEFMTDVNCESHIEMELLLDRDLIDALRILYTTIDELMDTDYNLGAGLDMHYGNIMLRPTSSGFQSVIIDPYETGNIQDYDRDTLEHWPADPLYNFGVRDLVLRRKIGLMDPPYLNGVFIAKVEGNFLLDIT